MSDRIPCFVNGCRITAPADKYPPNTDIICRKHWKLVPERLRKLDARYRAKERKLKRLYAKRGVSDPELKTLWRMRKKVWDEIRAQFTAPEKPAGMENFLKEMGME